MSRMILVSFFTMLIAIPGGYSQAHDVVSVNKKYISLDSDHDGLWEPNEQNFIQDSEVNQAQDDDSLLIEKPNTFQTSRITNGEIVHNRADFPSIVWLPDIACGGTILNPYFVVTAAHCLVNQTLSGDNDKITTVILDLSKEVYNVRTGMLNRGTRYELPPNEPYVQQVIMKRIELHSNYNPNTEENDIGIIQLCKPLNLTRAVKSVPIGWKFGDLEEIGNVAGWGMATRLNPAEKVLEDGPDSTVLRQAEQRLVRPAKCVLILQEYTSKENSSYTNRVRRTADYVFKNHICGLEVHHGQGQCKGDSGGPLYCYTKTDQTQVLCGIVSFGAACGYDGVPGVYTTFDKHSRKWLKGALGRSDCSKVPPSSCSQPAQRCSYRAIESC